METPKPENTSEDFSKQRPCVYRDLSTNEAMLAELYNEIEQTPGDSPKMEKLLGQLICERSSCLLNLRIALGHVTAGGNWEAVDDVNWAVPPDCQWREDSGIPYRP